jgi:Flp pilus assembly protein TadG
MKELEKIRRDRRREKGTTLMIGIMSLVFVIPMVGLTVDTGFLYTTRSKLQGAVDGASLAAARALTLGANLSSQEANAKQNAVNWFYANFPTGTWATSNTQMDASNVAIDDSSIPNLIKIQVSATTTIPTWFMKFLHFDSTTITVTGQASRRDVVAMMILDRSGSMNTTGGACAAMVAAGKIFTGQFAAGRDHIGLISFSDNYYMHSSPTTDFRTKLGYTQGSTSGSGELDTITCGGGTSTAQAMSAGWNELYKLNLPGAFNMLLLETDGLPNTMTLNFYDPTLTGTNKTLLASTSGCKDTASKTVAGGGFNAAAAIPSWSAGNNMGTGSYNFPGAPSGVVPPGMIASVYSSDPSQNGGVHYFLLAYQYFTTTKFNNTAALSNSTGCAFAGNSQSTSDFAYWPITDVYGNQLSPTNHSAYKTPVTLSNGRVPVTQVTSTDWTSYHNGALNATDDSAYSARTNATIPTNVFAIGLGGNTSGGSDAPDFILLQRIANDPTGDSFNTPPYYSACSAEPTCANYTNQPQGKFVFSTNKNDLGRAFLEISSQVLRLSK